MQPVHPPPPPPSPSSAVASPDILVPPDPSPQRAPKPAGLSQVALLVGVIALLLALPVLWWKISAQPAATSVVGEIAGEVAQAVKGVEAAPAWFAGLRASAMIAAFLTLVLGAVALILRHSGQLASIALVLGLAALSAVSFGLGMAIVGIVVLLGVVALTLGIA